MEILQNKIYLFVNDIILIIMIKMIKQGFK